MSFSRYSKLTKIAFSTIKAFLKRAPGEWIACKFSGAPPGVGEKFCWVGRITMRTEEWRDFRTRLKLREISADFWASDVARIIAAAQG